MAKAIHMMVRVLDERRAVEFYGQAFGMKIADRFDFDDFTLVYLRNPENDFEVELTVNKGREQAVSARRRVRPRRVRGRRPRRRAQAASRLGEEPADIKEFQGDGGLMARFFFVQDPDGYKIEVLQRHGRYR